MKENTISNFIITLLFGGFGVHKFMQGKTGVGVVYLLTFGLFGIGWFIDVIIALTALVSNGSSPAPATNPTPTIAQKSAQAPTVCGKLDAEEVYLDNPEILSDVSAEFIVIDFETTGLSPYIDRIIEMSAQRYRDGKFVDSFETLVNPMIPIPSRASEINNIYDSTVASAPREIDVIYKLRDFLGDCVIAAHNADFDIRFLREAYSRNGISAKCRYIDTLRVSRDIYCNLPNHKLSTIAEYIDVSVPLHRSGADAAVCAAILNNAVRIYSSNEIPVVAGSNLFDTDKSVVDALSVAAASVNISPRKMRLRRNKRFIILSTKSGVEILRIKPDGNKKYILVAQPEEKFRRIIGDIPVIVQAPESDGIDCARMMIDTADDIHNIAPYLKFYFGEVLE